MFVDPIEAVGLTKDSCSFIPATANYGQGYSGIPPIVYDWYASQGFIGYRACSILAQHWLIDRTCRMPADDAVRSGFDVVAEDQRIIDLFTKTHKKINLNASMQEFINFGRVFGIRIAIFIIDTTDPEFYEKPFNIDAVTANTFKGISQVDPYWVVPELTYEALSDPASLNYYEPSFYNINGKRYHKSHVCVYTPYPVPDSLKPWYMYGGKSIPQMIFNRAYAAERTADEAPQLAMAKRLFNVQVDQSAFSNPEGLKERFGYFSEFMNNYGIQITGQGEVITQFDTSLADFDNLTMTEYQLVAAGSEVPATKLLGTSPKGFNATGEFELKNYWQLLTGIRENVLTPFADRVNEIIMRSVVAPKLGISDIESIGLDIRWKSLDTPTTKERAEINKLKADAAAVWFGIGAIDGEDARIILSEDLDSDFYGIAENDEEAALNEETDEMGEPEKGTTII